MNQRLSAVSAVERFRMLCALSLTYGYKHTAYNAVNVNVFCAGVRPFALLSRDCFRTKFVVVVGRLLGNGAI